MSLNNKIEKTDLARDALYEKVNTIAEELDDKKQDNLVSGNNIKSINGESILGSGDIPIDGMQNKITNCITEIPQDIKLELNDGTLTLKAGSKVYVPNGFEVDGITPKFDVVVVASDIAFQKTPNETKVMFINYDVTTGSIMSNWVSRCSSGSTVPSSFQYGFFYNTTDNTIFDYRDVKSDNQVSLPLAIITAIPNDITSIDQVFNGFGYIGSTVFALPGVKGLIPNGRNEDGTLKNIELETDKVLTRTFSDTITNALLGINGAKFSRLNVVYYNYDVKANHNYNNGAIWNYLPIATHTETTGAISNFQPKLPFRAADWNEIVPTITYWE